MRTIYFDESGYTGEDLLHKEQPIFVLASISCDEEIAKSLKDEFFSDFQGDTLKHTVLKKKKKNQEAIRNFLAKLGSKNGIKSIIRFAVKRFVASGKMVDILIEPTLFADGIDLYERGGNMALSNLIYMTAPLAIGESQFQKILDLFIKVARTRQQHFYQSMMSEIDGAIRKAHNQEMAHEILSFYQIAHRRQGFKKLIANLPENSLDLALSFAMDLCGEWREFYGNAEEIRLLHDETSNMAKQEFIWKALLSPDLPPAIVGYDRRVYRFPIGISDIKFRPDRECVGLQLADIIAGSVAAGFRWLLVKKEPDDRYGQMVGEVLQDRIEELGIAGIFPSKDVTPEALETEGPKQADPLMYTGLVIQRARAKKLD